MALRRGRCKPVLPLQHRRELADRRAPAFVKTHFFMLRALFGRLVEHARRIERAAVLRREGQVRGQSEPGIGGLPASGEDGGEDDAFVRGRFEEAAVDVPTEFCGPCPEHSRHEAAARVWVELIDLSYVLRGTPLLLS